MLLHLDPPSVAAVRPSSIGHRSTSFLEYANDVSSLLHAFSSHRLKEGSMQLVLSRRAVFITMPSLCNKWRPLFERTSTRPINSSWVLHWVTRAVLMATGQWSHCWRHTTTRRLRWNWFFICTAHRPTSRAVCHSSVTVVTCTTPRSAASFHAVFIHRMPEPALKTGKIPPQDKTPSHPAT